MDDDGVVWEVIGESRGIGQKQKSMTFDEGKGKR
jgi:hypothetical protein